MKKFSVSMRCTIFASVEIEAKDKKQAEALASDWPYQDWKLQPYTLIPEDLERVTEIEE